MLTKILKAIVPP